MQIEPILNLSLNPNPSMLSLRILSNLPKPKVLSCLRSISSLQRSSNVLNRGWEDETRDLFPEPNQKPNLNSNFGFPELERFPNPNISTFYDPTQGNIVTEPNEEGPKSKDVERLEEASKERSGDLSSLNQIPDTDFWNREIGENPNPPIAPISEPIEQHLATKAIEEEPKVWGKSKVLVAKNKKAGKTRVSWVCESCGATMGQWWGSCPTCQLVGTMKQFSVSKVSKTRGAEVSEAVVQSWLPQSAGELVPQSLKEVNKERNQSEWRIPLSGHFGMEIAQVLGGGLVPGSLVLVGGDPGVGKSTLLLQLAAIIADGHKFNGPAPVIYVSGEESIAQIGNRADRMRITTADLFLYSSTDIEIVTDNGANFKAAGGILMRRFPTLYWTPCAAHCLDLMLEDIGKLKEFRPSITHGRGVTTFVYRHGRLLSSMREKTNGRDLVRSGTTRFATAFLTLQSLYKNRDALRKLFGGEDWYQSRLSTTTAGGKVHDVVLSMRFWNNVEDCIRSSQPLLVALRIVDGDEKPAMAEITAAMDFAKSKIKNALEKKPRLLKKVLNIIERRWESQMEVDLYGAALFLNPGKFFQIKENDVAYSSRLRMKFNDVLEKMVLDTNLVEKISDQADQYENSRNAFGKQLTIRQRSTKNPLDWWGAFGGLTIDLTMFAKRILGLCCSSSGCERNWSTFEFDILDKIQALSPQAVIIDSIQTVYLKGVPGSAGNVMQVKECTSALLRFAKQTNIPVFLIGHVTKSGDIAGPRILEHIVDVVLYMEGERYSSYRLLRSVKNRFGSADELGVFEMSESGLAAVSNPSEMFLTNHYSDSEVLAGLAVAVVVDGSRTFVIEIQALCVSGSSVSRHVNGVQESRADMIIAVLMKQAGLKLRENAIFLNVVSGFKLTETAGDLAIAAAICSSFLEFPIPNDVAFIGEIGLGGELRTVPRMDKRVMAVAKLGYKRCVVPKSAEKSLLSLDMSTTIVACSNLKEMINTIFREG